jgi:hypothetical protein
LVVLDWQGRHPPRGARVGGGVSVIIRRCQVQQEQALAHFVVTTPELFVAIEAKAKLAAFFHLGH